MRMIDLAAMATTLSAGSNPAAGRYVSRMKFTPARVDGKKKRPSAPNQTREQVRNLRRQGKVLCAPCGKGYVREQGVVIRRDLRQSGFDGEALGHGCSEACAKADLINTLANFHAW